MGGPHVKIPASRCWLGFGRCDITPSVGIYHRFWGAAAHDQATGVHRPLFADVLLMGQKGMFPGKQGVALVALDHCLLRPPEMQALREATAARVGLLPESITFVFSHTHSAAHLSRARKDLPGGDMIGPYLDTLPYLLAEAFDRARTAWGPVSIQHARAECDMAHQRDFHDPQTGEYVCGYNPEHSQRGYPVQVMRVTDQSGAVKVTLVHYPCHPTTLAWENTLISPDYVGALRETVEDTIAAPCMFLLGACGDIGPKVGFVGDTEIADRNGRQVGWTALSALASLPREAADLAYTGAVVSGATLATWGFEKHDATRQRQTEIFRSRAWTVDLAYPPEMPTLEQARADMQQLETDEAAARTRGDEPAARKLRALVERKRRLIDRLEPLPAGSQYPYPIRAWQFGDAFAVALEGEPYHEVQRALMARFPDHPLIVVPLANGSRCSYLPTREAYALPLYQVEVSMLAAGCLETIIESIAEQLTAWQNDAV